MGCPLLEEVGVLRWARGYVGRGYVGRTGRVRAERWREDGEGVAKDMDCRERYKEGKWEKEIRRDRERERARNG